MKAMSALLAALGLFAAVLQMHGAFPALPSTDARFLTAASRILSLFAAARSYSTWEARIRQRPPMGFANQGRGNVRRNNIGDSFVAALKERAKYAAEEKPVRRAIPEIGRFVLETRFFATRMRSASWN